MKGMFLKSYLVFLILIAMIIVIVPNAQGQVLYAVDGRGCTPSTLYEINQADGSIASTIGSTGVSGLNGLGFHPVTGVLYAISTGGSGCTPNLYTLNPTTGSATLIGPLGVAGGKPDMSFRSDGTLFTYSTHSGTGPLYTVNLATGAMTFIGDTGVSPWDIGLTFNLSDTLIMTDGDTVYTVDTTTGAATAISTFGPTNDTNMMTTHPGTGQIYMGDSDNSTTTTIYILDPTTGGLTTLGANNVPNMSAISFTTQAPPSRRVESVPTITEWGMIMFMILAGLGSVYYLRRQKRA